MQEPARIPQHPVRDELEDVERLGRAQHAPAQEVEPALGEHALFAAVLVFARRRRLLDRDRVRVVDRPPAPLHHRVREAEVVAEAGVAVHVVGAPHRVDGAVPARDPGQSRLVFPQPHLVAPVHALPARAAGIREPEPAADVGDIRIGEAADERAEGVGLPEGVGVREGDDLALRPGHRGVLRGHLALPGPGEQAHTRVLPGDRLDGRVGPVRRAVGGDDDLDALGRVVEREQVLQATCDHALLVVRGDDDRDLGRLVLPADRPRPETRERGRRERVARVRPGERAGADPEEGPGDHVRRPRRHNR